MTKLFVSAAMFAAVCGPAIPGPGEDDPRDITGNYDLTYDDQLKLQLNVGGAIREVTVNGYGAIADFGTVNGQPVKLDLAEFCAKPEVKCPSEVFWSKVAIDQPQLQQHGFDLQELRVINDTVHVLDAGMKAASLGGLVDHGNRDNFLLGLGAQGGATNNCLAFDISFANGRFSHKGEKLETTMEYRDEKNRACNPDAGTAVSDAGTPDAGASDAGLVDAGTTADAGQPSICALKPITRLVVPKGAAVEGIKDGKVGLLWAGGCAFGPVLVGATLYLETGYTGKRTGDFDPPPFTPAPVVLPDGGYDAGSADGG